MLKTRMQESNKVYFPFSSLRVFMRIRLERKGERERETGKTIRITKTLETFKLLNLTLWKNIEFNLHSFPHHTEVFLLVVSNFHFDISLFSFIFFLTLRHTHSYEFMISFIFINYFQFIFHHFHHVYGVVA